jgi:hypothetical protein
MRTEEALTNLMPSKKKAEVMLALREGNVVFAVFTKNAMKERKLVIDTAKASVKAFKGGKSKVVEFDLDDEKEKAFISSLGVNPDTDVPVTVVLNINGQNIGTFPNIADVNTLISTASKKVNSGCCSGGSLKGCSPPR